MADNNSPHTRIALYRWNLKATHVFGRKGQNRGLKHSLEKAGTKNRPTSKSINVTYTSKSSSLHISWLVSVYIWRFCVHNSCLPGLEEFKCCAVDVSRRSQVCSNYKSVVNSIATCNRYIAPQLWRRATLCWSMLLKNVSVLVKTQLIL